MVAAVGAIEIVHTWTAEGSSGRMDILHFILFCCFSVSALPPGPPPSVSLQTLTENIPSSTVTVPLPPASVKPTTEEQTEQRATTKLSDTTVVIIVSVSLALLVCAAIPLIFYGNWRSGAAQDRPGANKVDVEGSSTVRLHRVQSGGGP
ncbi:uncharacterized protein LOC144055194 [Vanacampus margaritifer]